VDISIKICVYTHELHDAQELFQPLKTFQDQVLEWALGQILLQEHRWRRDGCGPEAGLEGSNERQF